MNGRSLVKVNQACDFEMDFAMILLVAYRSFESSSFFFSEKQRW